jgi:hypothetical protein
MSSYKVVANVSKTIRTILWEAIDADPEVRPLVGSEAAIVFANPTATASDSANRLSLWLYQISENEFVKNQPMLRGNNHTTAQFPPLALNLFYLVTPFAPSGEADHLLLGKTMQTLYDHASVPVRDADDDIFEELRITFCRLTLEELTRIWEALREPYRLSVCYQIQVMRIESRRLPVHGRVAGREAAVGQKPAADE